MHKPCGAAKQLVPCCHLSDETQCITLLQDPMMKSQKLRPAGLKFCDFRQEGLHARTMPDTWLCAAKGLLQITHQVML